MSRLELVDIDQICFHEPVEPARLERTCHAIRQEGLLRHPIIATTLLEDRYLVLDGAHRAHSLQQLGCKKISLQIMEESEISFEAWDHLLPGGLWLEQLQQSSSIRWVSDVLSDPPVAEVVYFDQTRFWIYPEQSQQNSWNRLKLWHSIVKVYNQYHSVTRFPQGQICFPDSNYILFRYPTLNLAKIKDIVLAGQMVPAGVTRCIVQGRLLNLQVPLSLLNSALSTKEWNQFCEKKLNQLRLYTESIYLCEA